jgi:hypothetical protein
MKKVSSEQQKNIVIWQFDDDVALRLRRLLAAEVGLLPSLTE